MEKKDELSEDSQRRLDTNILRILDSKSRTDQQLLKDAPSILDFLGEESLEHFETVKTLLSSANIPYNIEPKLVRGLDYYTHTTFEIVSSKVGAQSALCGGGRYNLLVEQLGGTSTPAVGFAAGIERILMACKAEESFTLDKEIIDLYIVRVNKELEAKTFEFASAFRTKNFKVEFDYSSRSVKAQMREANKYNSRYVLFVGGDEFENGQVQLKNMENGEQKLLDMNDINQIIDLIKIK